MKQYITLIIVICSLGLQAQNHAPAGPAKRVLLVNGTAHIGNGNVLPNSAIGMADGKITFVMDNRGFKASRDAFDTIIDCTGKDIYPGLIGMNSIIGLSEMELVRATNDFNEAGTMNPSSRALIAYNTDSRVTPTIRSNGVLMAQIAPEGGTIAGSSSVVMLDGWNWEDAVYAADEGMFMRWPRLNLPHDPKAENTSEMDKRYAAQLENIDRYFADAKAYAEKSAPEVRNQNFEAMRGLFNGTKKVYIRSEYARDIISAITFAKKYKLKMVLVGGDDSWRVAPMLKADSIPVVIVRTHSLPYRDEEDTDLPYKLPFLLKQAGVKYCITESGFWQFRNLAFEAGTAAGYGLTKEEALRAVTLSPAEILGIDKTTGSLEDGKDATLFISSGDALDMRTNNVEAAFIQGKMIDLDTLQKELYAKYKTKYGLK